MSSWFQYLQRLTNTKSKIDNGHNCSYLSQHQNICNPQQSDKITNDTLPEVFSNARESVIISKVRQIIFYMYYYNNMKATTVVNTYTYIMEPQAQLTCYLLFCLFVYLLLFPSYLLTYTLIQSWPLHLYKLIKWTEDFWLYRHQRGSMVKRNLNLYFTKQLQMTQQQYSNIKTSAYSCHQKNFKAVIYNSLSIWHSMIAAKRPAKKYC